MLLGSKNTFNDIGVSQKDSIVYISPRQLQWIYEPKKPQLSTIVELSNITIDKLEVCDDCDQCTINFGDGTKKTYSRQDLKSCLPIVHGYENCGTNVSKKFKVTFSKVKTFNIAAQNVGSNTGCYDKKFIQGYKIGTDTLGYGFGGYTEFKDSNIPTTVLSVLPYTYENTSIISILIPQNIKYLGERAFFADYHVRNCDIQTTEMSSIEAQTFQYCYFDKMTYKEDWNLKEIKMYGLANTYMKSFVIPKSVERLYTGAFRASQYLTDISIGPNVSSMSQPFSGCSVLSGVHIDEENKWFTTIPETNIIVDKDTRTSVLFANACYPLSYGVGSINRCAYSSIKLPYLKIPNTLSVIGLISFDSTRISVLDCRDYEYGKYPYINNNLFNNSDASYKDNLSIYVSPENESIWKEKLPFWLSNIYGVSLDV